MYVALNRARLAVLPAALLLVFSVATQAQDAQNAALHLGIPEQVAQNAFLSVKLPVREKAQNPYDPRQIDVFARVVAPSGRQFTVPAYYSVGFDPLFRVLTRDDGWRLNLCPEESGLYQLRVFAGTNGEQGRAFAEGHFTAVPSPDPGFVGASSAPSGYFAFRNGRPFFPIGLNYCWGDSANPARYLETLLALSRKGANCVRIWLAPWWLPVEKTPGAYDQRACALLDLILEVSEQCGISVIVCIEQPVAFMSGKEQDLWPKNPYNHDLGGPCAKTTDFFTDAGARALTERKLRYLVARYGARRSVMAWELFNEVELFPFAFGNFKDNQPAVLDWHRQMALYLRRSDPYRHMIATSSSREFQETRLTEGLIDFVQLHAYSGGDVAVAVANALAPAAVATGAPVIVGEFGGRDSEKDLTGMQHGTWVTMAAGGAGAGLYWWEFGDALKEGANTLQAVSRFAAGIRWWEEQFVPAEIEMALAGSRDGGVVETHKDMTLTPGSGFGTEKKGICSVGRDGSISGERDLPSFLLGRDQPRERTSCALNLDMAAAGKLRVKVNSVSDRATLSLKIDGMPTAQKVLLTGPENKEARSSRRVEKWKAYQDVYDKEYDFNIPAGKHEVRLENAGKGWIKIDYITLPSYRIEQALPVSAWGLCGRTVGLVYAVVTDPKASKEGGGIYDIDLRMKGLQDGRYKLTWYDCNTGGEIGTTEAVCSEGRVALPVPELREHIAGKLVRQY